MSYELALAKAWLDLESETCEKKFSIRMLSDEYEIDLENKRIFSLACNVLAKTYVSILILHYLNRKLKGLPPLTGEWISFRGLEGGEGYFQAFRKRVIGPIVRKYGLKPEAIFDLSTRFKAKKAEFTENSLVLDVLDNVPFLITLEGSDEELGPEANLLFDKNIKNIFCTEDIVVLAEFVAANI